MFNSALDALGFEQLHDGNLAEHSKDSLSFPCHRGGNSSKDDQLPKYIPMYFKMVFGCETLGIAGF